MSGIAEDETDALDSAYEALLRPTVKVLYALLHLEYMSLGPSISLEHSDLAS